MDIVVTAAVSAQPEAVWAALVDVCNWPEMTASIDSLDLLDEGPLRLGSRARIKQPGMPALTWQVTELTDRKSFTWQAKSAGLVTIGRHELRPTTSGTSLVLVVEHHGLLAGIVNKLTGARTRRYLEMEANGLKARAEQQAADS